MGLRNAHRELKKVTEEQQEPTLVVIFLKDCPLIES